MEVEFVESSAKRAENDAENSERRKRRKSSVEERLKAAAAMRQVHEEARVAAESASAVAFTGKPAAPEEEDAKVDGGATNKAPPQG